jgi:hypothetical protein
MHIIQSPACLVQGTRMRRLGWRTFVCTARQHHPTCSNTTCSAPDDWVFMTRGNLTRVPVGTIDYTAGKLTLAGSGLSTSATWAPTPKLQDNAFCGAAVQTADRGIMMAGGHSPVRV